MRPQTAPLDTIRQSDGHEGVPSVPYATATTPDHRWRRRLRFVVLALCLLHVYRLVGNVRSTEALRNAYPAYAIFDHAVSWLTLCGAALTAVALVFDRRGPLRWMSPAVGPVLWLSAIAVSLIGDQVFELAFRHRWFQLSNAPGFSPNGALGWVARWLRAIGTAAVPWCALLLMRPTFVAWRVFWWGVLLAAVAAAAAELLLLANPGYRKYLFFWFPANRRGVQVYFSASRFWARRAEMFVYAFLILSSCAWPLRRLSVPLLYLGATLLVLIATYEAGLLHAISIWDYLHQTDIDGRGHRTSLLSLVDGLSYTCGEFTKVDWAFVLLALLGGRPRTR